LIGNVGASLSCVYEIRRASIRLQIRSIFAQLRVDNAEIGIPCDTNNANGDKTKLRGYKCEIDYLCGGINRPRIRVGAYIVFRFSTISDTPLPSRRGIDAKNQRTAKGAMIV